MTTTPVSSKKNSSTITKAEADFAYFAAVKQLAYACLHNVLTAVPLKDFMERNRMVFRSGKEANDLHVVRFKAYRQGMGKAEVEFDLAVYYVKQIVKKRPK